MSILVVSKNFGRLYLYCMVRIMTYRGPKLMPIEQQHLHKNACCHFLECKNYQALTHQNGRKYTYVTASARCDDTLGPGWFRFQEHTGKKMPTSCVPINRCNTHAPGWLNGAHPTVADGKVTRQVCFHFNNNCCRWAINIQVRNCGDFFVYYFNGTPAQHPCYLRYCSTD